MPLPRAIYLETTTLWGVAHRRDEPSLQTLRRYAENLLQIPLFTTGVVVDELVQEYRKELANHKVRLEAARDEFARRRFVLPTLNWPEPLEQVVARLPQVVRDNLVSYGLTVLPNQPVDQERLLAMAVRKELPFTEKGEKGFRDAVILLTILGHAQANGWINLMIVTNDKAIISSITSLPEAARHEIQIAHDIDSAVKNIVDFIDEVLQRYEASRKATCREAVLRERERVEEFIRQRGVFPETLFYNRLGFGESVSDIEKVSLTDVQVAAVAELPEKSTEGRVQVSLDADVDARIKVSHTFWPTVRRFRVGGEVQDEGRTSAILRRLPEDTRTIPLKVKLEGSVHARKVAVGREEFSDVRLDAFNPPSELLAALLAGLIEPPPPPPPQVE